MRHTVPGVIFMAYEHLRALREDRDVKQRQLAELLHVHQTTYSEYELGKTNIPPASLCILADFYQTSVDYLLDRTDVTQPYPNKRQGELR